MKGHRPSVKIIHLSSPEPVLRPGFRFKRKIAGAGKRRPPKKLESLIEVPNVVHMKAHVLCSKTELSILEKLWVDQVNCRSPKKLKSLIEVPNVVHRKVHVLSFNMILISSP